MLLKVTDTRDNSVTVVRVTMFDYEDRSSELKIWDSFNIPAIVRMEDHSTLVKCTHNMFENGKAQIFGSIVWSTPK